MQTIGVYSNTILIESLPVGAINVFPIGGPWGSLILYRFDPSVGPGVYIVTYTNTVTGCVLNQTVTVHPDVLPNITAAGVCPLDPCFDLLVVSGYDGLHYTGPGVSAGHIFCPSTVGPGIYTLNYCVQWGQCKGCATITIEVLNNCKMLVDDPAEGVNFHVYPNPNDGTFMIEMDKLLDDPAQIIVTNVLGQVILREMYIDERTTTLVIPNATPGLYFVSIRIGTEQSTKRVVVK